MTDKIRVRTNKQINAEKKTGRGFNLRSGQYRDRCYNYIIENGPCTAQHMLANIKTVDGQIIRRQKPSSPTALSSVLRRDKRFIKTGNSGPVIWDIAKSKEEPQ